MKSVTWDHAGIKIEGLSLAGVRTCVTLPQYLTAFDVAQGLPHALGMSTFLITHGHMDHAAGIPYVISQKSMNSHKTPRFIMPSSMVAPMKEIMRQWTLIEGHEYDLNFIGAEPGEEFALGPNLLIRTFPTIHRVPSHGYSVYRRSHKLRADLEGLSSEEIINIRRKGEDPTEEKLDLLVSFSGDTQIEFLDLTPEVRRSKILLLEATYLDDRKPVASAKEWGHTHLDEIIPRLESITSEKILLIHSSARYTPEEATKILLRRLPLHERERVEIFQGR